MRRNFKSHRGIESWTTSEFQIRQLMGSHGAKAVFIVDPGDGPAILKSVDCAFLGLATETITHWKKRDGEPEKQFQIQTIDNVIVCIDVQGGYERILNEAENFAGIQMPGQNIEDCVGQAGSDFLEKLTPKDTAHNERRGDPAVSHRTSFRRKPKISL